jgi:hypothetical protein
MRYVRSCRSTEARDIQRHDIRRTSGARLGRPACGAEDGSSGQKAHHPQTFGVVSVAGEAIPHLVTQAGSFEQSMEQNRDSTCADLVP